MKDRGAVTVDFNNYLLPGIYWYNGDPAVKNSPGSVAGNLEVIVTSSYVIHRITVYDRTYTRRYNGTVWTDWTSYLTNADIEPVQQSATKTIANATSLSTIATYTATKDENIMVGAYAGFPQNYTGIRSFGIYKGGAPIAMDKGPASEGEGSHQSSVFANIHLNAGESVNIAVQQNSGTSLSVTFVINSTRRFTFK